MVVVDASALLAVLAVLAGALAVGGAALPEAIRLAGWLAPSPCSSFSSRLRFPARTFARGAVVAVAVVLGSAWSVAFGVI